MKNLSFLLLLFSVAAFAAAPKKFTNDVLQFGGGANGSLKDLIFNTGAGTNPSIRANSGDGSLLLRTNSATLGDGTASDKELSFDIGQGANNPKLFWDNAAGALSFTNDGTLIKKIGSGSGGGGGENFNNAFADDQNPNAEDGLTNWTNTGGTFALNTADPLEGEQSFAFTPSAQNDFVQGPLLNVDRDIFRGRACQARIEYIGGDDNLELRIVDTSGTLFKSLTLPAHTIAAAEDVFFLCPSATEIAGDANLAGLRLQIYNAGASTAPLIKFDKSYLGTLIGLSESTTPDVFAARIECNGGGCNILTQTGDFLNGAPVRNSIGTYTVNFKPIFTVIPAVVALNYDNSAYSISASGQTLTSVQVAIRQMSTETATGDFTFHLFVSKQGVDAKQSVQVYKSIPKVSENINTFVANVSPLGVVENENTDWLNGDCTIGGTNNYIKTCNLNLSLVNGLVCTANSTNEQAYTSVSFLSTSQVVVRSLTNSGVASGSSFRLICSKAGSDFKLPTVQPILVNQVETPVLNGVKELACKFDNLGNIDSSNNLCNWVSSSSNVGGFLTVNANPGVCSSPLVCSCIALAGGNSGCAGTGTPTPTTHLFETYLTSTGATQAFNASIKCSCER